MKDESKGVPVGRSGHSRNAVDFGPRMASSESFATLFRDGMGLLEQTADYLDGPGRSESRELSRLGALAYATESMKLTTRLMQLASWLLLQRALNNGEMSQELASSEKRKVRLDHPEDRERSAGFDELPETLKQLVDQSLRLQARIRHLDRQLNGLEPPTPGLNPVGEQLSRVRNVFEGGESA